MLKLNITVIGEQRPEDLVDAVGLTYALLDGIQSALLRVYAGYVEGDLSGPWEELDLACTVSLETEEEGEGADHAATD